MRNDDVKAISLSRPWPHAILHLGKRIENRSDKRGRPPMLGYRGWLLLHAAKSWDKYVGSFMHQQKLFPIGAEVYHRREHPTGIVGRVRVVGEIHPMSDGSGRFEEVDFDFLHRPDELDMRWWTGGYAFALGDVEVLPQPIPCNGRLQLWRPPPHVLKELPVSWR